MAKDVAHFCKTCKICKKFKKHSKKYGKLPLKDVNHDMIPWDVVQIDTIGPYSVTTKDGKFLQL